MADGSVQTLGGIVDFFGTLVLPHDTFVADADFTFVPRAAHFACHNFVKIHQTAKTLAMAAGVTSRLWELNLIALLG
jgi:hypothetical protein